MQNKNYEILKKVSIVAGIALTLMIPLSLVEGQIEARQASQMNAERDVMKGWGDSVSFSAPFIYNGEKKLVPLSTETTIQIFTTEKKRGVFRVPVYSATLKAKATFAPFTLKHTGAYFRVGAGPFGGIQSFEVKDLNGNSLKSTYDDGGIVVSGNEIVGKEPVILFEITVRGTGAFSYEAFADQEQIKVSGNWPKPKFLDSLLPTKSSLTSAGFEDNVRKRASPQGNIHKWTSG